MNNYEKKYLEWKRKNIINLVRGKYGYKELTQDNANLEEVFCNPTLCSNCGECCHTAPCIFSPYDFLDICDIDYMKNILNTGLICISGSPDDRNTLILRPRGRADDKSIYSWTTEWNPCILENGEGCMLPVQYRPCQGLLQVPHERYRHTIGYSDYEVICDYRRFQEVLENLRHECGSKVIPYYEDKMEESVKSLIKSLVRYDKNCK